MDHTSTSQKAKYLLAVSMMLFSLLGSAQYSTLGIQDFDTIQTPTMGYSLTTGPAMTYSNGYTGSTSQIPSSPHGVGGTYGWYTLGQDVTVTFNNVNITGYDTAYISFKLAAFFDVDALDYVLVSISTNNGTTWYDRVRINGNGSNCSWSYAATGVVEHLFAPVNTTTTYTPPSTGVNPAGPSTIIIKVPNTGTSPANQVRIKIRQRESTSAEGYYIDNIAVKVRSNITNNASVTQLESPFNFCAGNNDVKVRIANRGNNIINNVFVNWSLNNVVQTPLYWSTLLDTSGGVNRSDTVVTLGSNFFGAGTTTNLKVWTSLPNGGPDGFNGDDTLNVALKPSLSGSFTIGGTTPDYPSLIAAVSDLNTYGVCGPVIFQVAPGTYSGQINIGNITGTSHINTITFNGSGTANTFITASVTTGAVISINQAKYIRFRNFSISNTSAGTCTAISIVGSNVSNAGSNNQIKNCRINVLNNTGNTGYGILVSGNANGFSPAGNRCDSLEIDSNVFMGGYYGINFNGNTNALYNRNNKIRNNTLVGNYYMGMMLADIYNALDVSNNSIQMDSLGDIASMGLYIYNCPNTNVSTFHYFGNNQIKHAGANGMYIYLANGTAANPSRIFNNMVAGNFRYNNANSVYLEEGAASYTLFYHNTLLMDFTQLANTFGGMYYAGSVNVKIKNNIFAQITGSGQGIPLYLLTSPTTGNLNNNVYYNASGSGLLYRNSTLYTANNYLSTSAGGDSSNHVNPFFANNKNVHISNGCLRGTNLLPFVPNDIDGDARSASPSMGADEIGLPANSISIESIVTPVSPFSSGSQNLVVRVKNGGSITLSSFTISYVLNNNTPVSIYWVGTLSACSYTNITFSGANQMVLGSVNNLMVYTSVPNGTTDDYPADDTLRQPMILPLNGTYTIGGVTPDFTNFSAATQALKLAGVSGSVQFLVRSGTYSEQFILENDVVGASQINRIQFRSEANHPDSVILTLNSPSLATVVLDGVNFVKLSNMTISASNINFGRVYQLIGDASYNTLDSCKVIGPIGGGYENIFADALTGTSNVISNNQILNNAIGIYLMGTSTTIQVDSFFVLGNTISNANSYAGYFYYTKNLKIKSNTVTGSSSYGFRTYYSYENAEIAYNNINITGTYGMYIYYSNGTAASGMMVYNNSIRVSGSYGIRNQYGSYQKFYHNSISAGTSYGAYILYNANQNNNLWMNNIIHTSGTSATNYAAYISNAGTGNNWDYNLYYSGGANLFSGFANLDAWRLSSNMDLHSVSYRPAFTSLTNLMPNTADTANWLINGRGAHVNILNDILGNPRSANPANGAPDLGAFEFVPLSTAPNAIPNMAPSAGSSQLFILGSDTVATISWDVTYPVPVTVSVKKYTGAFAPNTYVSDSRMNCFWDIRVDPPGVYSYTLKLFYYDPLLGNVSPETNLRLANSDSLNPWIPYTGSNSVVDVNRNTLTANALSSFMIFTGTHNLSPLPVVLSSFDATLLNRDVLIHWQTASEKNVSHFQIEASTNGTDFKNIGILKAIGNSEKVNRYQLLHTDAFPILENHNRIYYRLITNDRDGSQSISKRIFVDKLSSGSDHFTLGPNPFSEQLIFTAQGNLPGSYTLSVYDMCGKLLQQNFLVTEMDNKPIYLNAFTNLTKGMYFIAIEGNGVNQVLKFMKE